MADTKQRRGRTYMPPKPLCKSCGKEPYHGNPEKLCKSCAHINNVKNQLAGGS
jgi:ribosomal protein L37E